MKKLLSLLMSIVMVMSCFCAGTIVSNADEFADLEKEILNLYKNAPSISWDAETKSGTNPVSINSQSTKLSEYFGLLKFKPTATGWYEFSLDKVPETGTITITVATEDEDEEIYATEGSAGATAFMKIPDGQLKTGARLTVNKTYYVIVIGSETGPYSANVNVKPHIHTYGTEQVDTAYYEYDSDYDYTFAYDGSKYQECEHCSYEKTLETYYAPKTISLSYTSIVYNGKQRTPKVTIKDRKGNVIPASNYSVKYSSNIKPGVATVKITFNGKKYEGSATKTFVIKPRKAILSSVNSPSSKKITVKWSKDANATGYQIAYSTSTKFTKNTTKYVTVSNNRIVSKSISGLQGGKKYAVKIREYKKVGSKNYYGDWSATKIVTVKK